MSKVAIALSGLPRLSKITAASWGRIIGKYNCDVYIHSWGDESIRDELNWIYKPIRLQIDSPIGVNTSIFPDRIYPFVDVYKSFSMWEGISRAFNMVKESGIHYDIVIRGRMDWHVHHLDLIEWDGVVLPYDPDKFVLKFNYNGNDMMGINDQFAYGPISSMEKYVNVINDVYSLYHNDGIDFCPEIFLAASLKKQGIEIYYQHLQHHLIRG